MTPQKFLYLLLLLLTACDTNPPVQVIVCGDAPSLSCPDWSYCHLDEHCGGIDRKGICKRRPDYCADEDKPVCGCDGQTYMNECWANAKGMSVHTQGACKEL